MKLLLLLGGLGVGPYAIAAQASGDVPSTGAVAPWLTAGAVLSLSTLVWKILNDRIKKLEDANTKLVDAANRRAEEDRKMLIPLLSRSVEAQAAYITRHMGAEIEESS